MDGKGTIKIERQKDNYKSLFEKEKGRITKTFKAVKHFKIEHMGSTAIPGLGGKNIVDISLALKNLQLAKKCLKKLSEIGYLHDPKAGVPRKRIFLSKGEPAKFHLHIVKKGSKIHRDSLAFRNYLINHPEAAEEYFQHKKRWIQKAGTERIKYTKLKTNFITNILKKLK